MEKASLRFPEEACRASLRAAISAGASILQQGGTALDAAVMAVRCLEDAPEFNAGRGSVLTQIGTVECEASVMDGSTRRSGSVIGLKAVKNPVLAALAVTQHTSHSALAGPAADDFAREAGLEMCDQSYLITVSRAAQLREVQSAIAIAAASATTGTSTPSTVLDHDAGLSGKHALFGWRGIPTWKIMKRTE